MCGKSVVLNTAVYVRKWCIIVFCLTLWERIVCEKEVYGLL